MSEQEDADAYMQAKVEDQSSGIVTLSNDDIVCKDCGMAYDDSKVKGNTSRCMVYSQKPDSILCGGQCKYILSL
jgi:hypothetical protein